jgi:adenosylcobyric acid synthase
MNPLLLKSGGIVDGTPRVQVVHQGRVVANEPWASYQERHAALLPAVLAAYHDLAELTKARVILLEGAGSCVELNLMARDIVNLPLVRALGCKWLLVCDIDRGGVFAQAVGVRACVPGEDWAQCIGVVVNKLRGEPEVFDDGRRLLEGMLERRVYVVPFLADLGLEDEDGVALEHRLSQDRTPVPGRHHVVVVGYPHAAMASDVTALEGDPALDVRWRGAPPTPGTPVHAVVLPGSKLTRADLAWLVWTGFAPWIVEQARRGVPVVGICGGYQMLGLRVEDPHGLEGEPGGSEGLGLLPVVTVLELHKCVHPRRARFVEPMPNDTASEPIAGYEVHCGVTRRLRGAPLLCWEDTGMMDGCRVGSVSGTYLHGLFDTRAARLRLLGAGSDGPHGDPLDRLARHLESCGLTVAAVLRNA